MKKANTCIPPEEEEAYYERNKENHLRYIRAKLPGATAEQLGIIAAFIGGLRVMGWSESEYFRDI